MYIYVYAMAVYSHHSSMIVASMCYVATVYIVHVELCYTASHIARCLKLYMYTYSYNYSQQ